MSFVKGCDLETSLECVDPGWHNLIRAAFMAKPAETAIVQVREKFGALRIYFEPYEQLYQVIIQGLEIQSTRLCEKCGEWQDVELRAGNPGGYWLKTLCATHHKERDDNLADLDHVKHVRNRK